MVVPLRWLAHTTYDFAGSFTASSLSEQDVRLQSPLDAGVCRSVLPERLGLADDCRIAFLKLATLTPQPV